MLHQRILWTRNSMKLPQCVFLIKNRWNFSYYFLNLQFFQTEVLVAQFNRQLKLFNSLQGTYTDLFVAQGGEGVIKGLEITKEYVADEKKICTIKN